MLKTYILTPNYSTPPPPAGPLHLGTLLTDLTDLTPLYPAHRIPNPPSSLLPIDTKHNLTATRATLASGTFGIWAQFCAIFGIGIEAGWVHDKSSSDMISFERIETHAFLPSEEYVRDAVAAPPVKAFLQAGGRTAAVYIVTGLKIGIGGALVSGSSRERGVRLKLGLAYPGVPVEGGPEVGWRRRVEEGLAFEGSSDFVVAFRARKIGVRKGVVRSEAYNKG